MFDVPPIPAQSSETRSGIAITIDQDVRPSFLKKFKAEVKNVFFIKLEDKNDSLKKYKTISSNYYYVPFMAGFQADAVDCFLLDIEPGAYAAVGATIGEHYIYFPEEVIKASIVEVNPNRIEYMGEFQFKDISYDKNNISPDELQHHYYVNLLIGNHNSSKVALPWGKSTLFHVPEINKIINSNDTEIDFLEGYLGLFAKTPWIDSIKNRLFDLRP